MEKDRLLSRLKRTYIVSGALIVLMLIVSAYAWIQVPAGKKIPVHWGMDGKPDRYGGKFEALLAIPLMALGVALLFAFLPVIEPRKLNLQRSWKAYSAVWLSLMLLLAVIHVALVMLGLGRSVNMNLVASVLLGGLFIVFGNYMGKLRSNFFVGIKTPWTLSSELSWNKTHRLGGRLFVLIGFVLLLVGIIGSMKLMLIVLPAAACTAVVITAVYSYLVWRKDPAKQKVGR